MNSHGWRPPQRLVPRVIAKRSYGKAHVVSQVSVHHFKPGDDCEDNGRPSWWLLASAAALATSAGLLSLGCDRNELSGKPSQGVNAVDVVRAIALWNTCCVHWGFEFPFRSLKNKIDEAFWSDNPYLIEMTRCRFQTALEAGWHIHMHSRHVI